MNLALIDIWWFKLKGRAYWKALIVHWKRRMSEISFHDTEKLFKEQVIGMVKKLIPLRKSSTTTLRLIGEATAQ